MHFKVPDAYRHKHSLKRVASLVERYNDLPSLGYRHAQLETLKNSRNSLNLPYELNVETRAGHLSRKISMTQGTICKHIAYKENFWNKS